MYLVNEQLQQWYGFDAPWMSLRRDQPRKHIAVPFLMCPGAPSSVRSLLVAMPGAPSSFLFLAVPGARSSVPLDVQTVSGLRSLLRGLIRQVYLAWLLGGHDVQRGGGIEETATRAHSLPECVREG